MTSADNVTATALERDGFAVLPRQVDEARCLAARRRLWQELRTHGVTPDEVNKWGHATWFPWLRDEEFIWNLIPDGQPLLRARERWAEPQIIVRLPDLDDVIPGPGHLDALPPWAGETDRYVFIMFVELTGCTGQGGGTRVWPQSHRARKHHPVTIETNPGDVVILDPMTIHAGSPNYSSDVRMAVTFRLIGAAT